jgi:histidine triad (HIT) family protein
MAFFMSASTTDCVFCKIVQGILPAEKVYEDDRIVAFRDANPVAPIHILIVPRVHIPTLNDVPEGDDILARVGEVARKIAHQQGVAQSGYRVFINVNKGGGQVVFHLHVHLVAGGHFGRRLIEMAVALSVLLRKVTNLFRPGRP